MSSRVLAERYEILEKIGEGVAVVYWVGLIVEPLRSLKFET